MTPAELTGAAFAAYPKAGQQFAVEHLSLLQRLPLIVCPSFLEQIQKLHTMFPAERELLRRQCESLRALPAAQLATLTAPLGAIALPDTLRRMDWVQAPAQFVTDLTAHLWSAGQINQFRDAITALFATVPAQGDAPSRTVVVILGQGATVNPARVLRKLRPHGVTLTAVQHETAFADIGARLGQHMPSASTRYDAWYVDGGSPHPELAKMYEGKGTTVSYPELNPIRQGVLARMQAHLSGGQGGAEQMRAHMSEVTPKEAGAHQVTADPVLQSFYTELFTASSGPQIFSTSFVQWAGRELIRRAQPQSILLRYAPRQRHRGLNEMFAQDGHEVDPQGSLLDAEMGAFYTWLEMKRITPANKLTFLAWVEGQPTAVMLAPGAPASAATDTPMTLSQAFTNFS